MNKNNDKERATHENYWEPKKNLGTHQGNTNREPQKNQGKTNEKPKKEQWKTTESQRQFCQHSKLLLGRDFCPLFFRVFHLQWGKKIRDILQEKMMPALRCLGSCMFTKPRKYAVNCIFSLHMCFKRNYFYVCCFWGTRMEENTLHGENLACHFIPKICILYGNTVVRLSAHWNLEYSWPAF